jgi:replication initiation protein RepC
MDYKPVTPFRRTIDAAILKHQAATQEELPPTGANKWEVLRELAAARVTFGLSDRDLTVLQALVSFHQATILGGNDSELIVYPSNKAICERLNGMPCSTMRRHLSNLVQTGFVVRRDSPNGKRYARRYGDEKVAFGFDLSPLVRRFQDICEAAEAVRAADERYKRLRATVSLMRRDLAGLAEYGLGPILRSCGPSGSRPS